MYPVHCSFQKSKGMEVIGIDISKDTFDVWRTSKGHNQFTNDKKGFKAFVKSLNEDDHCVMEATGCYHVQLASFIYEAGILISVVNGLIIKRFIQMKMQRTKTDKSDAKMICMFGQEQCPVGWEPEPEFIEESKLRLTLVSMYIKQSTQLKNKIDNLNSGGITRGIMISSLKRQLKRVTVEIGKLEQSVEQLFKENAPQVLTNTMSIPGIGKKTALLILVTTNMFRDFSAPRQVVSYVGLAPVERKSGSSLRGRSYISKMGNPLLRNHLFMCSFTASKCNPQCKALYERITAKGTSKKSALVAVCGKLLKQAFGVNKSGIPYDPTYVSRKAA